MKIRMYGTRGITPSPGWETKKYGGNTSCIAIRLEDSNNLIIIDAGTGIIKLGQELANASTDLQIKLFLTHIHMDHIQGFPFFLPIYDRRNHITVYSPHYQHVTVEKVFKLLISDQVNPVQLRQPQAKIHYEYMTENVVTHKTLKIKLCRVNHPILTYGYRFEHLNKVLCIMTDHEPAENLLQKTADREAYTLSDADYCSFINNCDILIADAQYLPDEVKMYRGWGHAHVNYIVNKAIVANVKRLVLTHHDPNRTDLQIDTILDQYRTILMKKGIPMEIIAAKEIEEYTL
ncbi:MAG: MBL fold metallo-hydrolase [Spirochaetia bacterium]|nr:MBL fold metallo-hydrolase [Spirochaetia bacterium]